MKIEKSANGGVIIRDADNKIFQVLNSRTIYIHVHSENSNAITISNKPTNLGRREGIVLEVNKVTMIDGIAFSGTRDELMLKLDQIFGEQNKAIGSSLGGAGVAGNSPKQEILDGTSKTYTGFQNLTFTVYNGTAAVTIGGTVLTYPLDGDNGKILGKSIPLEAVVDGQIIINATNGKVLVSIIE